VPASRLGEARLVWVAEVIRMMMSKKRSAHFIIVFLGSVIATSGACGSCSNSVQRCVAYSKTIVEFSARGGEEKLAVFAFIKLALRWFVSFIRYSALRYFHPVFAQNFSHLI
jgi:hypothetical protein